MSEEQREQIDNIKVAILELHNDGAFHVGCPWDGVDRDHVEKLKAIEPLPDGAVKMVVLTWNVLATFGKKVGNILAAGLFVVLIAVLLAGAFGIAKLCGMIPWFGK